MTHWLSTSGLASDISHIFKCAELNYLITPDSVVHPACLLKHVCLDGPLSFILHSSGTSALEENLLYGGQLSTKLRGHIRAWGL